jgi:hypothetical protein
VSEENKLGLPGGIKEKAFVEAVEKSGYPLQIVAGALLADRSFELEEEWAFQDPETEQRRTVDIAARLPYPDLLTRSEVTLGPSLALLIECKQSRDPYVFFEAVSPPSLEGFPEVIGLGGDSMSVSMPEGPARTLTIAESLGAHRHPFVTDPPVAASLSRATGDGTKVKLSGEEPYRSLLLPLVKAMSRYRRQWRGDAPDGWDQRHRYDLRAPLAVSVVDAPMIFVGRPSQDPAMRSIQWVRLLVREPVSWTKSNSGMVFQRGGGVVFVDVVHCNFLAEFLDEVLLPFGEMLFTRLGTIPDQVLNRKSTLAELPTEPVAASPRSG